MVEGVPGRWAASVWAGAWSSALGGGVKIRKNGCYWRVPGRWAASVWGLSVGQMFVLLERRERDGKEGGND